LRINNNITAVNSHRQLGINQRSLGVHTERLSSGMRVNRAADDSAGLAISEKMRTQIRGLNRASLNIQDGSSLLQVGDGALQFVHDKMQRMRELAVQAANGTNDNLDRAAIQLEFGQLTSEINSVMSQTNFNGKTLFDGSIGDPGAFHLGLESYAVDHTATANADFGTVNVPIPTVPAGFGLLTSATLAGLENGPFPNDGLFAMQIVTPANGTLNVFLDFSIHNPGPPPGSMNRQQFLDFFTNGFNSLGLGTVVNGMSMAGNQLIVDFPHVAGTTPRQLTGVMGRLGPTTARMQMNISPMSADIANSLNGLATSVAPRPVLTNRPDLQGSFVSGNAANFRGSLVTGAVLSPAISGEIPSTTTITVDGVATTVPLARGNFTDAASFVAANSELFRNATPRSFELALDPDNPDRITLTTRDVGGRNLTIDSITATSATPTTPAMLLAAMGLSTFATSSERVEGESLWIQSGANAGDGHGIKMPNLSTRALGLSIIRPLDEHEDIAHISGLGAAGYVTTANVEPGGPPPVVWEFSLSVMSHELASNAISVLDNAINIISMERAQIGAQHNRLDFTRANVDNTAENLTAAESRIRDTDMALEMTHFVRGQILTQSSTAMLAQANALPQSMLQLLG